MHDADGQIEIRHHGRAGPVVFALHGGPAAVGEAAGIARGLADRYRVLEPWQRPSGAGPLTVARHVADLHALVQDCGHDRPAIVGESWGAMLALAYAAAHPTSAGPLVLVGCGTFDPAARAEMHRRIEARTTDAMRKRLAGLQQEIGDPAERMKAMFEVLRPIYEVDPLVEESIEGDPAPPAFDPGAHEQTWQDMLRCQREGLYPASFAAIESPVFMIHGQDDPHPGPMIRDSLRAVLPQLRYVELPRCGHSPWRERSAREGFFRVLREFLAETW